jgi:cytochrome c5
MRLGPSIDRRSSGLPPWGTRLRHALPWLLVLAGATLVCETVAAQPRARSGKAVVDTYCASCHAKGTDNAPRIGDDKAWATRAAQGLSALTTHALQGIRNMPAHGGNPGLNDIEIERAITHMVNLSGGRWVEPLGGATPAVMRTGEQVVQAQCATCHQEGKDGAPRIGDRQAWAPRLSKGLDAVVKSAIHGHGGMPARGGLPDLSDAEIHGAIVYMFNKGLPAGTPQTVNVVAANPYHKVVDGTDVYFDIVRTDSLPASQRMKAKGAPKGSNVFRVNISLYDVKTQSVIKDASVKVEVSDTAGAQTQALRPFAADGSLGYSGFFRMPGANPYTITAQIRRPGAASVTEATFEYSVW